MKDEFNATFTVEIAPDEAWPALARKTDDQRQSAIDSPPGTQVWLPGWEMTGEVLEVVPGQKLLLRKDAHPCKGTEILITLEHEGSGTKVTIVQSGFGAHFDAAVKVLGLGWDFIVRDLALYLETGVFAHRHMNAWSGLGADVEQTASGLRVTKVKPDTLAARAGLQPGDRLLTLAGATVVELRDMITAARTQRGVPSVELTWVRGRELMKGAGSFQRGAEIHLDGSPARPAAGVSCRIDVRGIDALYAEIEPKGVVKPDEKLETKPWGVRQFSVLDPAGNRITFAERTAR